MEINSQYIFFEDVLLIQNYTDQLQTYYDI